MSERKEPYTCVGCKWFEDDGGHTWCHKIGGVNPSPAFCDGGYEGAQACHSCHEKDAVIAELRAQIANLETGIKKVEGDFMHFYALANRLEADLQIMDDYALDFRDGPQIATG